MRKSPRRKGAQNHERKKHSGVCYDGAVVLPARAQQPGPRDFAEVNIAQRLNERFRRTLSFAYEDGKAVRSAITSGRSRSSLLSCISIVPHYARKSSTASCAR